MKLYHSDLVCRSHHYEQARDDNKTRLETVSNMTERLNALPLRGVGIQYLDYHPNRTLYRETSPQRLCGPLSYHIAVSIVSALR